MIFCQDNILVTLHIAASPLWRKLPPRLLIFLKLLNTSFYINIKIKTSPTNEIIIFSLILLISSKMKFLLEYIQRMPLCQRWTSCRNWRALMSQYIFHDNNNRLLFFCRQNTFSILLIILDGLWWVMRSKKGCSNKFKNSNTISKATIPKNSISLVLVIKLRLSNK